MYYSVTIKNVITYTPLIKELVSRDLKVKYRRSFLGYLWSLLNPLFMMAILAFVFSRVFRSEIECFPLYLISGNTLFTFFTESTNMAMNSIVRNGSLIKKVYIPKFIFPLASVFSSFTIMGFSLVAVFIVKFALGVPLFWADLLLPIPLLLELVFCMGMGLVLAALNVYFRDIEHLYGVLTMAWMYLTPIIYSIDILPETTQKVIKLNPMYHYIQFYRLLTMKGYVPDINTWIACAISSLVMLLIGLLFFRKVQKNFIFYL